IMHIDEWVRNRLLTDCTRRLDIIGGAIGHTHNASRVTDNETAEVPIPLFLRRAHKGMYFVARALNLWLLNPVPLILLYMLQEKERAVSYLRAGNQQTVFIPGHYKIDEQGRLEFLNGYSRARSTLFDSIASS